MNRLLKNKSLYLFVIVLFLMEFWHKESMLLYWLRLGLLFLYSIYNIRCTQSRVPYLSKFILITACPFLFALVYSFFLVLCGDAEFFYVQRGVSETLQLGISFVCIYSILNRYREKSLDFLFLGLSISYFILTISGVFTYGIGYVLQTIFDLSGERFMSTGEGREFDEIFEIHQYGLILPLFAVYYLLSNKNILPKFIIVAMSLIISLSCAKRIAIVAAFITFCYMFICKIPLIKKYTVILAPTAFLLITGISLIFIYSGLILILAYQYEINLMGRDVFYSYFISGSSLSVDFIGHGWGYIGRYLSLKDPFDGVMGLHNDIFRIYLELGFIGSIMFFYITFIFRIRYMLSRDAELGFHSIVCTVYCLITYLTDNTITYPLVQMTVIAIPISIYFSNIKYIGYNRSKRVRRTC